MHTTRGRTLSLQSMDRIIKISLWKSDPFLLLFTGHLEINKHPVYVNNNEVNLK